jgi:hypothetical protein
VRRRRFIENPVAPPTGLGILPILMTGISAVGLIANLATKRASRAVSGEFENASSRVMDAVTQFKKTLSPRDVAMLQLGMRASHMEEALAQGDTARAESHRQKLVQLLENMPS